MKQLNLWLLSLLLLPFLSCKDAPSPPALQENYSDVVMAPLPDLSGYGVIDGICATYLVKTPFGFDAVEAHAQFGAKGLYAGNVDVNGFILTQATVRGTLFYSASGLDAPEINFDGTNHQFSASGGNEIPPIEVNVTSAKDFLLMTPQTSDEIDRDGGVEIVWSEGSDNSEERMLISITPLGGDTVYVERDVPNTGTYTITTDDLQQVPSSFPVILNVVKYRLNSQEISGSTYIGLSEVNYVRVITITD